MKIIVCTPAGRERYLRLLSHYVLGSDAVAEWHLWDNCRTEADRAYLHELARSDLRCRLKNLPGADGGFGIIGDFFQFCDDPDAIYIRFDDDVVFIQPGFFESFAARMLQARGEAIWFAPIIVNNAVCGALLKQLSSVSVDGPITFQAMCPFAWRHPEFPKALHPVLMEAVRSGRLEQFHTPDRDLRLGRFSINALAFFGSEKVALGDDFCPVGKGNDEEWLSAILPARLNRPARILGDHVVAHFSFFTQEREMLQTDLLDRYYALAGLAAPAYEKPVDKVRLRQRLRPWRKKKRERPSYRISLRDA